MIDADWENGLAFMIFCVLTVFILYTIAGVLEDIRDMRGRK